MPKAIIVGGGIGGLTAALCLAARGWAVRVLEQAPALGEVGAGVQLSPNAMKVLRKLGLEEAVAAVAFQPDGNEMRIGATGARVFEIKTDAAAMARWGAPYLQIHRADLLDILAGALAERAPEAVRTNALVSGYRQEDGHAVAVLESGEEAGGDVLVGADGIHSAVRAQMLGADAPRFTGAIAWRAVVPTERLGDLAPPKTGCVWVGSGRHAVSYYLRGGALVNLVGVVARGDWREEGWTLRGTKAEALADFTGYHPIVRNIIEQADAHHRWAIYDRPPLPQWAAGRVALLGDACHPMPPFLAQGAAMAVEDAWVLAAQAAENPDIPEALRRYRTLRFPRTAKMQKAARANGRLFRRRTKLGQWATYGTLKLAARLFPAAMSRRLDWIYGHDVVG